MTAATPLLDTETLNTLPEDIRPFFSGDKAEKKPTAFEDARIKFDYLQEIEKFKEKVRKTSKLYSVIKESVFGFMSPDGTLHLQLGLLWPALMEEQYSDVKRRFETQLALLKDMEDGRVMFQLPPDEQGVLPPLAPIVLNMEKIRQQTRNDLIEIDLFNPDSRRISLVQAFHPKCLEEAFGLTQHVLHIESYHKNIVSVTGFVPAMKQVAYTNSIKAYQENLHRIERRPADPQILFYARASIKKQQIARHVEGTYQQMAIDAYLKSQGNK